MGLHKTNRVKLLSYITNLSQRYHLVIMSELLPLCDWGDNNDFRNNLSSGKVQGGFETTYILVSNTLGEGDFMISIKINPASFTVHVFFCLIHATTT